MNRWNSLSLGKKIGIFTNLFFVGYILGWKVPFSQINSELFVVVVLSVFSIVSILRFSKLSLLMAGIASVAFLFLVGADLSSKYLFQYIGTSAAAWYAFYLPPAVSGGVLSSVQIAYVFKAALTNKGESKQRELRLRKMPNPESTAEKTNVYLRNTGKGKLEVMDDFVKFYVEKGLISKKQENLKEIPIAEITELSLDGKEISLVWKETTEHIVFQDSSIARSYLDKLTVPSVNREITQEPLIQKLEPETNEISMPQPEAILQNEQTQLEQPITSIQQTTTIQEIPIDVTFEFSKSTFEIVDSLFDILLNLNGRINWNSLNKSIEKLKQKKDNMDGFQTRVETARLEEEYRKGNTDSMLKETYAILLSIEKDIELRLSENKENTKVTIDPKKAIESVRSYYFLNDIILGITVNDETIQTEVNQFKNLIESETRYSEKKANLTEILEVFAKLEPRKLDEQTITKCRRAFQEQLNPRLTE